MYGVYIIQATTKHTTIWICIFFFRQHINFDGAEYLSVFFFEDSFAYGSTFTCYHFNFIDDFAQCSSLLRTFFFWYEHIQIHCGRGYCYFSISFVLKNVKN